MNATSSNSAAAGATGGHTAKIMVVDDDVRLRDLLRRYLTEQGFQVVTAESAPAMNKLWLRERYDLLVLDLMLPGEDGLSICRRLRGAGDRTPIIMLTAKGEDVDRIVGLEMGAAAPGRGDSHVLEVVPLAADQRLEQRDQRVSRLRRGRSGSRGRHGGLLPISLTERDHGVQL